MARENSPKNRQRAELERKQNKRASYDRIMIVCEGEKTEPLYFDEIRQFYRLSTTNIKVRQSDYGTQPQKVVDFAIEECLKTKRWEHVYCVFDRDDHPGFHNALQSVAAIDQKYKNDLKQPIRFAAIPSIPSFELWLLLHFDCITREIHRDEVVSLLRQPNRLPSYDKGQGGHFARTRDKLPVAFDHAAQLIAERKRHGNENPFTAVGELVQRLVALGDR
ncbi:MAG: RloB family protein [Nitrosomonadaceae bacterium]